MGAICSLGWCCCEAACCLTCCGLSAVCPGTKCAKIGASTLIAVAYLTTALFGTWWSGVFEWFPGTKLTAYCDGSYEDNCELNEMMYRMAASLLIVGSLSAVGAAFYAPIHHGWWGLKFSLVYFLWSWLLFTSNHGYNKLANIVRFVSWFWLLLQSLLVMELSFQANDKFLAVSGTSDGSPSGVMQGLYMLTVVGLLVLGVTGTVYLYTDYSDCALGGWLVTLTTVFNGVSLVLSVMDSVGVGPLPGTVLFCYTTFLCWYAMLSAPNSSCNPSALTDTLSSGNKQTALWVILGVTAAAVSYMCWMGAGTLALLFSAEGADATAGAQSDAKLNAVLAGESVPLKAEEKTADAEAGEAEGGEAEKASKADEEPPEEPREEVVFFHALMLLLTCYMLMVVTSWGKTDGTPDGVGGDTEPYESVWIKITAQWASFGFFFLACRKQYNDNADPDSQI